MPNQPQLWRTPQEQIRWNPYQQNDEETTMQQIRSGPDEILAFLYY